VAAVVASCAQSSFGNETKTTECIIQETGLSDDCGACFGASAACVVKNCLTQCIGGASSPGCVSCREQNCDPAFIDCAGVVPQ
jgi:hypothetical protein